MSTRYAFVGLGHRAQMYVDALLGDWRDTGTIVALCDVNRTRMDYYVERIGQRRAVLRPRRVRQDARAGRRRRGHHSGRHPRPLRRRRAGRAGRRHRGEAADHRRRGLRGASPTPPTEHRAELVVTFNYRYSPRNRAVKRGHRRRRDRRGHLRALRVGAGHRARRRLLPPLAPRQGELRRPAGAQGDPPLRPGQLVDRRRARAACTRAAACGSTAPTTPPTAGLGRPARAAARPALGGDPFALDLAADARLKALYLEAEQHDGYLRDQDVFGRRHHDRGQHGARSSTTPAAPR